MRYDVEEARRIIADKGYIARVSRLGVGLLVYEGEEENPGTWMEIARLAIKNGQVELGPDFLA